MEFLKKYWLLIIAIIFAVIFVRKCDSGGGCNRKPDTIVSIDTLVAHDTVWRKQDTIFISTYRPTPDTVIEYVTEYVVEDLSKLSLDETRAELIRERAKNRATAIYQDSWKIYDSTTKTNIATFNLKDEVTGNRITKRTPSYTIDSLPTITKTLSITKTVEKAKKGKVYVGAEVGGNQERPIASYGIGIMYQTKQDKIFKLGYEQTRIDKQTINQFKVGAYFKL